MPIVNNCSVTCYISYKLDVTDIKWPRHVQNPDVLNIFLNHTQIHLHDYEKHYLSKVKICNTCHTINKDCTYVPMCTINGGRVCKLQFNCHAT